MTYVPARQDRLYYVAMSGFETAILRTWSEHSITVLVFIYLVIINMKVNVIYCIIEWVLSNNGIN